MSDWARNTSDVLSSLHWRYAVKRFDPTRRIDPITWTAIEQSLVLTPSSFGLQPWQFCVVQSPEIKSQLPAISWNQTQPRDCSHMVVFAARKNVDLDYVDSFMARVASVRGVDVSTLNGYRDVIANFLNHNNGRHLAWSSNQAYIALGQLLATAASLAIDACPMEGIEAAKYDEVLGLTGTDFTTVVGCALGYRHSDDKYAEAPKVRFPADDLVKYY